MSSEVCPFCGKTYKRLKTHLPHCKAAANSKTPPTQHDVTANPTTSSSQLAAGLSEKKSTQTKKSKKVSEVSSGPPQSSSPATPLKSANTLSTSQPASSPLSSTSTSTKKKKQKLSDQIKMANMPSSTTFSLISSPSLSPSPALSKPKKKSLRALIEAAKTNQVSEGPLEGTSSSSLSLVTSPLSSGTKTDPDKDSCAHPALLSTDTKPKRASKKEVSQSLSQTNNTSASLDSTVNESSARENFWEDNKGEREDLSGNEMFWKSESSSHQAKITLQDVKTMLSRAKTSGQSSRSGILGKIESNTSLSPAPLPAGNQKDDVSCLVTTKLSNQLPSTSLQHKELIPANRNKSKQTSLIPLQDDGSLQSKLSSPATPLLSDHLSAQVSPATILPHTVSMNEGLKVGHHMTSLTQFSRPHRFLLATQTPPVRVETMEKLQLEAGDGTKGALNQRSLGQVRLRELPKWLACKSPTHPRDVVEIMQRGWQWYYRRYIDVKKGSVGGLSMLLAGYCVLSYIWSYPHIKRDRWRKYH